MSDTSSANSGTGMCEKAFHPKNRTCLSVSEALVDPDRAFSPPTLMDDHSAHLERLQLWCLDHFSFLILHTSQVEVNAGLEGP